MVEIHNNKQHTEVPESHLFSLKENEIFYKRSPYQHGVDNEKRSKYLNWYKDYCKLYLLSNFTLREINEINYNLFRSELLSNTDLIKIIHTLDIDDLIKLIPQ